MGACLCTHLEVVTKAVSSAEIPQFRGVYCTVWMSVSGLPYIRPMPNVSAVAGEPLYVACPAAGYPIDSIVWQKGNWDLKILQLNEM